MLSATVYDSASASCRHCGDPVFVDPVESESGLFCCAGCQAVFELLRHEGLDHYYRCAETPGRSQRDAASRAPDRFSSLDDPDVAAAFLEFDDGRIARARLPVPALHCASCVWLLERLWKLHPGVVAAEVDLLHQSLRVTFRPGETTLRAVAERLAMLGYEPTITIEHAVAAVPAARRRLYRQLGVAGFAFGNIMIFSIPRYAHGGPLEPGFQRLFDVLNLAFALPVLLFSAAHWFAGAWRAVRARHVTLDFPVALGLAVLFGRSVFDIATGGGEGYLDSFAGLVFFLLLGRLFQQKTFEQMAFDRTYRSFFPLSVRVERGGACDVVPIAQLVPGDHIVVRPQELVPADAVLLDGAGTVDYAFATGEQTPVEVRAGDTVRAGGRVTARTLRLRVARAVSHSRLAGLWANPVLGVGKPSAYAAVTDRFGFWFTAFAVALAAAGAWWWWPDAGMSARVATAVLIIACPCALTLAAPVTLGTALGRLGQHGVYARTSDVVFALGQVDTIAFDKTGTLTSATTPVVVEHGGLSEADWRLARALASESVHPVSRALCDAGPGHGTVTALAEQPGHGVSGLVDGHHVRIGSGDFVRVAAGLQPGDAGASEPDGAVTHVAVGDRVGWVRVRVAERAGIEDAVRTLGRTHRLCLISGDNDREAGRWAPVFGAAMAFRQSPEAKLEVVRALARQGRRVLMLGDGLNDAGALAAAHVGVAVSDATACVVPACDAVIAGSRVRDLGAVLWYARLAHHVILLAFAFSVVYNVVALSLAVGGALTPLLSAILMPVSSLTVVGLGAGAMRLAARRLP
jgi:Cu+-exporting ATPase